MADFKWFVDWEWVTLMIQISDIHSVTYFKKHALGIIAKQRDTIIMPYAEEYWKPLWDTFTVAEWTHLKI